MIDPSAANDLHNLLGSDLNRKAEARYVLCPGNTRRWQAPLKL